MGRFVQEEARLEAREEKLSDDEDQAFAAHFRKGKKKKEIILHRRSFRNLRKVRETILNSNVFVVKSWDILPEIVLS